jgi:hypothetical protein
MKIEAMIFEGFSREIVASGKAISLFPKRTIPWLNELLFSNSRRQSANDQPVCSEVPE